MSNKDLMDQTIALAGVLQSVILVNKLALTGEFDQVNAKSLIDSVFVENPETALHVYGSIDAIMLGLKALGNNLGKSESVQTMSYFNALLTLSKRIVKEDTLMNIMDEGMTQIKGRLAHFPSDHINIHSALADLYTQTVSKLSPRILVKGRQALSENAEDASRVRALLLSGIRSGILWHQCNGSRMGLLFNSRGIIEMALNLSQYKTSI